MPNELNYESDYHCAAYGFSRGISESLLKKAARTSYTCADCKKPINRTVGRMILREGRTYHETPCAQRAERRQEVISGNNLPDRAIGRIRGRACPLGVFGHTGCDEYEKLERGVFAKSLELGGQTLQVGHDGIPIPGTLHLSQQPDGLDFLFDVHDSARGRDVLQWMRAGRCRGCSVRYRVEREARDPFTKGRVILQADLTEVSLVRDGRPAWYDTFAQLVD